jgi:hypothetical protein
MPFNNTRERLDDFDLSFKIFHELMPNKITDILLVSSPYEAFVMEEEGRLAERIIHEYRGLNLSRPPLLTWVSSSREALDMLGRNRFDLVLTMPRVDETDAYVLSRRIKEKFSDLPVYLLVHSASRHLLHHRYSDRKIIDRIWAWHGNTDLLLAIIKNREDRLNVAHDTRRARVRVIVIVEDSPFYYSSLLPLLYKEIVTQTQAVMEESVNDEHRILRMRARPKILMAQNYEEALDMYQKYKPYLLSIFSDIRFPKKGVVDDRAGFDLLAGIRQDHPDLPLLALSSEENNRGKAEGIPAVFLNKNSPTLHSEIRKFFIQFLGFGDFIFRLPDGTEIARASNLRQMEEMVFTIPNDSVIYHAQSNHFSAWLMARSEIMLATKLKPVKVSDFNSPNEIKKYLADAIHERRVGRQKGLISAFDPENFDPAADFVKIGQGSLGGKARGLAFMSTQLKKNPKRSKTFSGIDISVPKTLVVSTEGFDTFINNNNLKELSSGEYDDARICESCIAAHFPEGIRHYLELFLAQTRYPLAVRSSSLLEDAQYQPYAGIYKTYMIPNNDPDLNQRLDQLILAIKLVYASTFYQASRAFAKSTSYRTEDEKMAVIIQQLTGKARDDYYYPAISGVAHSYNYYPISHLKPEEGIAHIAAGLGKTVVEGGTSLRFTPRYPRFLPQFSTVDDILKNSQRSLYALKMDSFPRNLSINENATLAKLELDDVSHHAVMKFLCSTYLAQDHRIRDGVQTSGFPVLTFANILKYDAFPLAEIISELLQIGRRGLGCPVEMEFAVSLPLGTREKSKFNLLQIRPMAAGQPFSGVDISAAEIRRAFCYSTMALGNGRIDRITDIIYVDPDAFDPARTVDIASEVGVFNGKLVEEKRKYLLIGPGRWGSADRWLGIPVRWNDISAVGAIVETAAENLKADPSQGSHFFHNMTSLGIGYFTTSVNDGSFINWQWLQSLKAIRETRYLKHIKLRKALTIKINGKKSQAVILA